MVLFTSSNFPHARPGYIGPRANFAASDSHYEPIPQPRIERELASDGLDYYGLWYSMVGPELSDTELAPKHNLRPGGFVKDTQHHDFR